MRKVLPVWFFALALLLAVCPRSYAPLFNRFPGIDELIERSEIIAVVEIMEHKSSENGIDGAHKIRFLRVLKGKPAANELVVRLRELGIPTPTEKERWQIIESAPFRPYTRHVVFLERGSATGNDPSVYYNVNCEGSHFPVSTYANLKLLEGKSLMEGLTFLLRDYCEFKRAELKHVEERTEIMLRGR